MSFFQPLNTEEQKRFYDDLSSGKVKRGIFGVEKRFSPEVARTSPSFQKYFMALIEPILRPSMNVVDIGCGTGMYFPLIAPLVRSVTGIELSEGFARLARQTVLDYGLTNVTIMMQDSEKQGFKDRSFDAALCIDSLHHVYDLDRTLREMARIVKRAGDIVIVEPNLANPLLMLVLFADRNEWGALSRCYLKRYVNLFGRYFDQVHGAYNGLVIGPQNRLTLALADFMLSKWTAPVIGRFSPKLFFHMKNR